MKTKIYYEYVNKDYLQKIILLGDLFGTSIRNIDVRTREDSSYRIYFTNGKRRQGFIDERVRDGLSEKYFELKMPLGIVKGAFCHMMNPEIDFSLVVSRRPYDTFLSLYNACFPNYFSLNSGLDSL